MVFPTFVTINITSQATQKDVVVPQKSHRSEGRQDGNLSSSIDVLQETLNLAISHCFADEINEMDKSAGRANLLLLLTNYANMWRSRCSCRCLSSTTND